MSASGNAAIDLPPPSPRDGNHVLSDQAVSATLAAASPVATSNNAPQTNNAAQASQAAAVSAPARSTSAATGQVAQVLVGMSGAGGVHRVTVQLAPKELGRVQISVTRGADGTAAINVTAERPETLLLVKSDAAHLQAALDQAGVAAHGRTLHFHLAGPAASAATQSDQTAAQGEPQPATVHPIAAAQDGRFDADASAGGTAFQPDGGANPQPFQNGQAGQDGARRTWQPIPLASDPSTFIEEGLPGTLTGQLSHLRAIDIIT